MRSGTEKVEIWMMSRVTFKRVANMAIDAADVVRTGVVYFDQRLGTAHSKHWLKCGFSTFFVHKSCKKGKKQEI